MYIYLILVPTHIKQLYLERKFLKILAKKSCVDSKYLTHMEKDTDFCCFG